MSDRNLKKLQYWWTRFKIGINEKLRQPYPLVRTTFGGPGRNTCLLTSMFSLPIQFSLSLPKRLMSIFCSWFETQYRVRDLPTSHVSQVWTHINAHNHVQLVRTHFENKLEELHSTIYVHTSKVWSYWKDFTGCERHVISKSFFSCQCAACCMVRVSEKTWSTCSVKYSFNEVHTEWSTH